MRELVRTTGALGLGDDFDYVLDRYARLGESPSRQAFLRTLRSVVDWRGQVVNMLDRCYLTEHMPTMLVWGGRDNVVPTPHAELAHQAMPASRLEVFPGAGHFPHHSEPDRFLRVLRAFLTETAPATHDPRQWRQLLRLGRPRRRNPGPGAAAASTMPSGT
ncbi:alpha/beta fold hydrolase [Prauserella oleivorans]